jgi:hypothetical protein
VRDAAEIIGSVLCAVAAAGLLAFALLASLGHSIANEPFGLTFLALLAAALLLAAGLSAAAVRLGLGRWPLSGRR